MKQTASSFNCTTGKIFFLIAGFALIPILTTSAFLYYLDCQNIKNRYKEPAGLPDQSENHRSYPLPCPQDKAGQKSDSACNP